ncbi:MAG TPA: hypothetical protein IAC82_00940 [Candidatus Merdivicinus intestinigallinarum]|nr:hypothetical protein [Candidatus Merdivicinus intestinigallinarum]
MEHGYDRERIDALREPAVQKTVNYREFTLHFYRDLMASYWQKPFVLRYADALYASFDRTEPVIGEGELIVGRIADREFSKEEEADWEKIQKYAMAAGPSPFGQDSHMTVDYERLLEKGTSGIRREIAEMRENLDLTLPEDLEKDLFYASCQRCLEGVERFAQRYSQYAAGLAKQCADPGRKKELLRISEICAHVPKKPARDFYEAVQSVHFLTFCLSNKPLKPTSPQYQLGRPDRYFWPFYQRDMEAGRITEEEAQTLLDCLAIQINHRVPHGLSSGYMVGGRDAEGRVVSNDLTRMLMRVVEQVRLVYPSVGLCWCRDTPAEDLETAAKIIGKGHSHPAIFNDEVITEGLKRLGLPPEEACSYIHSTCVEITPIAASNVWVASPYMNLVQKLLDVLDREYSSMEELFDAYFAHIGEGIRENLIAEQKSRLERQRFNLDPLLSCFVRDCLEAGRDIEWGGARYNWIMPSFVGLSNAADALYAIRELIFNQKRWDFAGLNKMLAANFQGFETQRQMILREAEKYGNDADGPDSYVQRISQWIAAECGKYRRDDGFRLAPSLFCWVMHDVFGQETGASPDGRLKGFPLGDGSGPAQGREQNGPTAAVLSCTKWDHTPFIGGIAMNMKFSRKYFKEDSLRKMTALIRTYLKRGGFELQINVVDRDTLLAAREQPELYRDLVVRIGGYSDYFTRLSPTMQAEVIERTEYEL